MKHLRIIITTIALMACNMLPAQDVPIYTAAPSAGGTLEGCKGVSLQPGFSFTASTGKSLTIRTNTQKCSNEVINTSVSANRNYIVTITPLDETSMVKYNRGRIEIDRTAHGDVRTLVDITYFDGLGRPVQNVQRGITPTGQDLVTYQEYDAFGRESNSWLPAVVNGNGSFQPLTAVQTASAVIYSNDTKAYNKPVYEASPLNRVVEQYGPGQVWHNNKKAVRTAYLTNNGTYPCIQFEAGTNTAVNKGNYAYGQLYVTEITKLQHRL